MTSYIYPNKVKHVGKGGCVQNHFSKKNTSTVTHCFYLLVEFSITFHVKYVKKNLSKIKKLPITSLVLIVQSLIGKLLAIYFK